MKKHEGDVAQLQKIFKNEIDRLNDKHQVELESNLQVLTEKLEKEKNNREVRTCCLLVNRFLTSDTGCPKATEGNGRTIFFSFE